MLPLTLSLPRFSDLDNFQLGQSDVYGNTAEKSPLRRLFVDMCLYQCNTGYFGEDFYENHSRRFLFDSALAHCEVAEGIRSKTQNFTADRSLYYLPSHN